MGKRHAAAPRSVYTGTGAERAADRVAEAEPGLPTPTAQRPCGQESQADGEHRTPAVLM